MTLIRDINNNLQYGHKTTTYKFTTLLSIFDYIVEHPTEAPINNLHFIPVVYLAKQFISHYYPFSFHTYYQGSLAAGKYLKVINKIKNFQEKLQTLDSSLNKTLLKIQSLKEQGVFWLSRLYELPTPLPKSLIDLLWITRRIILDQPLKFLHKVKGEEIRFFSIINIASPFNSSYDRHRSEGVKVKKPNEVLWDDILLAEKTYIVIDDLTYQELARYRFWAREVILKSWFKFSLEGEKKTQMDVQLHSLIGYFYSEEYSRDPTIISHYRNIYININALKCVYSSEVFNLKDKFHLDHLLPWSYYPVNRFWNLYPCDSIINIRKSNFIPKWTPDLEINVRNHLQICLEYKDKEIGKLVLNDLNYFYYILHRNESLNLENRDKGQIEEEIIAFIKQERKNLAEIIPGKNYLYIEE